MPFGELMTGMRYFVRKLGELLARLGQRHAVADEDRPGGARPAACRAPPARRPARRRCGACRSRPRPARAATSASSWNRLNGMSTFTGPGRPLVIVVTAWRSASGSMSTRVGWKLRLTTGRIDVREIRLVVPVQFLERPAVELRGRHVRGDREQRGRIGLRDGERHDEVRGARTGRGERRDRLVLHAEVAVGHVRGGLLVARRDELDLVAHLVQRIEQADVAVAADAEHVGDLLLDQEFRDEIATFPRHGLAARVGRARQALVRRFVHRAVLYVANACAAAEGRTARGRTAWSAAR